MRIVIFGKYLNVGMSRKMCFGNEIFECKIIKERLSWFLINSLNVYIDKSSYILNCLWSFFDLIFKFFLMWFILILGYWIIVFFYI